MTALAANLDAEVLEITDGKDRNGVRGFIGAAIDGLRKKLPRLQPFSTAVDLNEYDRIIVGAPIWSEDICPIARAFLMKYADEINGALYCVVTHMSENTYLKKIHKLEGGMRRTVDGYLSLQTENNDWMPEVSAFAEKICE